jgi:hypothetical protein
MKSGANRIRCNNKIFTLISDLEFFNKDSMMLSGKFDIVIDNNIVNDELIVYYDGRKGLSEGDESFNYVLIKILNYL